MICSWIGQGVSCWATSRVCRYYFGDLNERLEDLRGELQEMHQELHEMLKETRELLDRSLEDGLDILQVLAKNDRNGAACKDDMARFCAVASFRALKMFTQVEKDCEALEGFSDAPLD